MTRSHAITLNALGLYAVAFVLAAAFAAQLILNELPCLGVDVDIGSKIPQAPRTHARDDLGIVYL